MRSIKSINEQRDENRNSATAIYERAIDERRDMTDAEAKRFDQHAGNFKSLGRELAVTEMERATVGGRGMNTYTNQNSFSQNSDRPDLVLPTNGVPVGDERRQLPMHRIARLKCFSDPRVAYDSGMYLRAVIGREYHRIDQRAEEHCQRIGWQVTNVGVEGTGSAGGYVVPSPLSNTIVDVREAVGIARRILNPTPMTSDTLSIPKRTGGLTVYYVPEATAITLSDKTWSLVELLAKKRAVAHQISQELVDDSLINIVDDAVREMAYALADKEDAEIINGDGTSTYGLVTGLKSALGAGGVSTAATGHDTWAELDLADMTAAMALLPDRYHARGPVWVCSSAFYFSVMLRLHAAAGGNTIVSLQGGDNGVKNFLGYPVYLSQYMPTSTAAATVCAFFGSFSAGCLLGERIGVRIARSDDYAFLNDVTTLRATTRYDFKVHDGGTVSLPGCYVGLKTAA